MTPSVLAHAVGVTEGAIRQMETGATRGTSFVVGLRIAGALGVGEWYLATGTDRPDLDEASENVRLEARVAELERKIKVLEGDRPVSSTPVLRRLDGDAQAG
jgi:hypothetical protein